MRFKKLALISLVVIFTGCEEYFEKKDGEPDGSNPYIAISSPADNSTFIGTQSIKIESVISDKDDVKEFEVQIVKMEDAKGPNANANANATDNANSISSNNHAVWSFKKFPIKNPVVVDTAFSASQLPAGEYLLTLNTIDGRTNVGIKEVKFTVK